MSFVLSALSRPRFIGLARVSCRLAGMRELSNSVIEYPQCTLNRRNHKSEKGPPPDLQVAQGTHKHESNGNPPNNYNKTKHAHA
eukprot:7389669-Prymnesium_polylepis.1